MKNKKKKKKIMMMMIIIIIIIIINNLPYGRSTEATKACSPHIEILCFLF